MILAEAKDLDCDLIVIGARGHSFFGRLLIGSVSDSIATHAKCSVLVVRPDEQDDEPSDVNPTSSRRIIIGYDGSNASGEAVEEIWHWIGTQPPMWNWSALRRSMTTFSETDCRPRRSPTRRKFSRR